MRNNLQPTRASVYADWAQTGVSPHCRDKAHTDAEASLEAALLHLEGSGVNREDMPWWQQLRTLVQAGVPMVCNLRLHCS